MNASIHASSYKKHFQKKFYKYFPAHSHSYHCDDHFHSSGWKETTFFSDDKQGQ